MNFCGSVFTLLASPVVILSYWVQQPSCCLCLPNLLFTCFLLPSNTNLIYFCFSSSLHKIPGKLYFPAHFQQRSWKGSYRVFTTFAWTLCCFLHAFRITLCSIEKIKGSVCLKKKLMKRLTELLFILETSCCGCHSNNKPFIKAIFYMFCLYYNVRLGELQIHESVLWKEFSSFVQLNYPRNLCYRSIKHVNLVYHIYGGIVHAGHHFMQPFTVIAMK